MFMNLALFKLIMEGQSCPYKCRSGARLRFREARTLPFSIVPTDETEDYKAVLGSVIQAVALQRQKLQQIADDNSKRIKTLSTRVTNQTQALSRFAASTRKAIADQREVIGQLRIVEDRVSKEVSRERALLAELAAAQQRLSNAKSLRSNARGSNILRAVSTSVTRGGMATVDTTGLDILAAAATTLSKRKRDPSSPPESQAKGARPTRRRRLA
ncbi:hypothetical protein MD484_g9109, partial [Candolleomyces efflorescens]